MAYIPCSPILANTCRTTTKLSYELKCVDYGQFGYLAIAIMIKDMHAQLHAHMYSQILYDYIHMHVSVVATELLISFIEVTLQVAMQRWIKSQKRDVETWAF